MTQIKHITLAFRLTFAEYRALRRLRRSKDETNTLLLRRLVLDAVAAHARPERPIEAAPSAPATESEETDR